MPHPNGEPMAEEHAAEARELLKAGHWRVGFYVEVEVDAYDGEAELIANAACGWPGDWRPPHEPVETHGVFDGGRIPVSARILRSQALMIKPAPEAE